jgi:hypothetical protein
MWGSICQAFPWCDCWKIVCENSEGTIIRFQRFVG